jgi:predicted CoA-substrate-specific enzyme activase
MDVFLGVDVGSVTTKFALINDSGELITYNYLRTQGKPIVVVQQGLKEIKGRLPLQAEIRGVCTTGSARYLAGVILGADVVKNEITAQSVATLHYIPDVRTILEIGGQDSKLIIIQDGMVVDFAMNTICAAGTGSFLEQQASRLNIGIEEFGHRALQSRAPVRIDGRCTVFAESDMIHRQQMGHGTEDIICGLCHSLVRNYLNDVGMGKDIIPPVVFQGGVAFNEGVVHAFEESLNTEVIVPLYHEAMGAIGAALVVRDEVYQRGRPTAFTGFEASDMNYHSSSFECQSCSDNCEVAQIFQNDRIIAYWGGRCDLWEGASNAQAENA